MFSCIFKLHHLTKKINTFCIGICRLEPIVEVIKLGEDRVTYMKVTPNKVRNFIEQHIICKS